MAPKKPAPIKIAKSKQGSFTKKAENAGMTVAQYANKVLSKNSRASAATKKQANFARNFGRIARKNAKK